MTRGLPFACSYRRFQSRQVAEAARRDERLKFELDTMAGEGLEAVVADRPTDGVRQVMHHPTNGRRSCILAGASMPATTPVLKGLAPDGDGLTDGLVLSGADAKHIAMSTERRIRAV